MAKDILKIEEYQPGPLFDLISRELQCPSDSALARRLGISAPIICRMRQRTVPINAGMLIRLHDATGKSIDELRMLAGIPRTNFAASIEQ